MRTSCNGCRVLRKGCNDDCVIRPSLEWIKSPDSQANATVFLAKFYGRAGLLNLLSPGPAQLRPAIFKSLLYEACGRIVDPVYGSVGLMWSGQWHHCQGAVDAILRGLPIIQVPEPLSHPPDHTRSAVAGGSHAIPLAAALKLCDIRHVSSSSSGRSKVKVATPEQWEEVEADEDESLFSNETVEASVANPDITGYPGLELRLGLAK